MSEKENSQGKKISEHLPLEVGHARALRWMNLANRILEEDSFPVLLDAVKKKDVDAFRKKCIELGFPNDMILQLWRMAEPDQGMPGWPCW